MKGVFHMKLKFDEKYCIDTFKRLIDIDSTTGQYEEIQKLTCEILDELGVPYDVTHKGGVIADLGGEGNALTVVT